MTTTTVSKQEQAEALIVEMDSVQVELEQTSDWRLGASCAAQLEGLKQDIAALGFQVQRVPTGWKLVEPVVAGEAACATSPQVALLEDEMGLYAQVPSSNGKGCYTVRVCAKWLYSTECDCPAGMHGRDCAHRGKIDRAFDSVRPSFSEQCKAVTVSQETINALLSKDRYSQPFKGSGVHGFRAASIERKLAA